MTNTPKLLKARCFHSKIFFAVMVALLLTCYGLFEPEGLIHEEAEAIGVVMVAACILGRSYSSMFIGGKKNVGVVTDGPFSIVRNPLYVFSFLGWIGIALQTGMVTLLVAAIVAFILYYHFVVRREEAFLAHKFGQEYLDYMARVPRWWPNFKLWRESDMIEVSPRLVRITMMDCMIFVLVFPALELIEWLHTDKILPNLLQLP